MGEKREELKLPITPRRILMKGPIFDLSVVAWMGIYKVAKIGSLRRGGELRTEVI